MNTGHVYVLALSNDTVKVGQTKDAAQRMNTHKSAARSLGLTVTDKWISPPHAEWLANERALKAIAAELGGTPLGPEVFGGIGFAAVVEKARALTFTPAEADQRTPVPAPTQCACQGRDVRAAARDRSIALTVSSEVTKTLVGLVDTARIVLDAGMSPDEIKDQSWAHAFLAEIMRMLINEERRMRSGAN